MKKTHPAGGDNAILLYHVCKAPELKEPTKGNGSEKTGRISYTVVEFYKNKSGLDNHFAMFHAGHECADFGKLFGELMEGGNATFSANVRRDRGLRQRLRLQGAA